MRKGSINHPGTEQPGPHLGKSLSGQPKLCKYSVNE